MGTRLRRRRLAIFFCVMRSASPHLYRFVYKNESLIKLHITGRSKNSTIQLIAFDKIVHDVVHNPSLRNTVHSFCHERNEDIDAIAFSWKRPKLSYSSLWLYYYTLASRCLSTSHSSPVIDAINNLHPNMLFSLTFSDFDKILSSCRYGYCSSLFRPSGGNYLSS